jgi:hypothetical protein
MILLCFLFSCCKHQYDNDISTTTTSIVLTLLLLYSHPKSHDRVQYWCTHFCMMHTGYSIIINTVQFAEIQYCMQYERLLHVRHGNPDYIGLVEPDAALWNIKRNESILKTATSRREWKTKRSKQGSVISYEWCCDFLRGGLRGRRGRSCVPSGNRTKFCSLTNQDTAMSPPSMVFFIIWSVGSEHKKKGNARVVPRREKRCARARVCVCVGGGARDKRAH